MRLFIAEKPDLAKAIATGLVGCEKTFNGYIQKGNDLITWAFGHILKLAEPEVYDEKYKSWDVNLLPIKFNEFRFLPIEDKKKQLKIICELIKKSDVDTIIHCGDADDEGQILIDEILTYANNKKPVLRALLNDLTPKGIKRDLEKLKSNSNFYNLSQKGFARSQADWIVGINLTRAYTNLAKKSGFDGVLSVGRVQTPILSLIVDRDKEFESFKSINYYILNGMFKINNDIIKAKLKTDDKIFEESIANEIKTKCESKNAFIHVESKDEKEYPPLPYSLLLLQADCAKLYGLAPDKTLAITQSLREKYKAITYNRSDCQYLPETIYELSPSILSTVKHNFKNEAMKHFIESANTKIKSKAFDDKNITAHHGIIPTDNEFDVSKLDKSELAIYELICKRFIVQFFEPREYKKTTCDFECYGGYIFRTGQIKTLKLGFREFLNSDNSTDEDDENEGNPENTFNLLNLKDNSMSICNNIEIEKKETKPRPYYTMTTLLKDLNSVAKYIKDERIKKLFLEKDKGKKGEHGGIGTPATRSVHIKNLIDKEYISVSKDKKQTIKSTLKGRNLINLAPKSLAAIDTTALWFEQQKQIEAGDLKKQDFLNSVTEEVIREIKKLKSENVLSNMVNEKDKIKCPKCENGYLIRRKAQKGNSFWWGCSNYYNGCKAIYFDFNGKPKL
ncbi:DNA topoisomerase 3 [Campylobacter fetus]|uniref:DNA topoisomerase 3 n=1 Tax=Campylobacter fetus TaxID=196 RepID=UPI000818A76A|nr:DNA topoisomerase 3 [Campylobacter fetus]OCR84649.1 DNA topoisomerase III [Campylobacter fetus subsp. testudinum]OCR95678.1 DNA topoisomerase III [Campylobacter fetus subsp. testudinum]